MRRRSLIDIEEDLFMKLSICKDGEKKLLAAALYEARDNGIRLAASVASDYDKSSGHPYLVSDCILGKLNVLKGKPRKNKAWDQINVSLSTIERYITALERRKNKRGQS